MKVTATNDHGDLGEIDFLGLMSDTHLQILSVAGSSYILMLFSVPYQNFNLGCHDNREVERMLQGIIY